MVNDIIILECLCGLCACFDCCSSAACTRGFSLSANAQPSPVVGLSAGELASSLRDLQSGAYNIRACARACCWRVRVCVWFGCVSRCRLQIAQRARMCLSVRFKSSLCVWQPGSYAHKTRPNISATTTTSTQITCELRFLVAAATSRFLLPGPCAIFTSFHCRCNCQLKIAQK